MGFSLNITSLSFVTFQRHPAVNLCSIHLFTASTRWSLIKYILEHRQETGRSYRLSVYLYEFDFTEVKAIMFRSSIDEAIIQADVEKLQSLLQKGAQLPSTLSNRFSPLTWATEIQNGTLTLLLVKAGADMDEPDQRNNFPQYTLAMNVNEILDRNKKFLNTSFSIHPGGLFTSVNPEIVTEVRNRVDRIKRFGHVLGVGTTITIQQKSHTSLEPRALMVDTEGLEYPKKSNVILQEMILRYLFQKNAKEKPIFLEILQAIDQPTSVELDKISHGALTIIITGYRSHTTTVAILGDYFIYANRGKYDVSIFKLTEDQKSKITLGWLTNLKDSQNVSEVSADTRIISQVVDLNNPIAVLKHNKQRRGNCGITNPKLIIEGILYVRFILSGKENERSRLEAQAIYKIFTCISRDLEIDKALFSMRTDNPIEKKMYLDLLEQYLIEHHGSPNKTFSTALSIFGHAEEKRAVLPDAKENNPEPVSSSRSLSNSPVLQKNPRKMTEEETRAKRILFSISDEQRTEMLAALAKKNVNLSPLILTHRHDEIDKRRNTCVLM
jgi:hypothetical protein